MNLLAALILLVIVLTAASVWYAFRDRVVPGDQEKGSLFETDPDKITLRSADNVRMLSDEQVSELEQKDE